MGSAMVLAYSTLCLSAVGLIRLMLQHCSRNVLCPEVWQCRACASTQAALSRALGGTACGRRYAVQASRVLPHAHKRGEGHCGGQGPDVMTRPRVVKHGQTLWGPDLCVAAQGLCGQVCRLLGCEHHTRRVQAE